MTQPAKPSPPKIQSTSHIAQTNFSVLYQGPAGEGKTTCAFSWPSPFGLYFDKNLGTLRDFPNIPYVTPQTWAEVEQTWLPAIANRRLTEIVQGFTDEQGQKPYATYKVRTLVVDSLTNFLNMNFMELGSSGAKSLGYDGWDQYYGRINRFITICTQASIPDPRRPERETYHFVATIHEEAEKNAEGVVTKIKPSVQGKMASHLTSYFDSVLLTETTTELTEMPAEKGKAPEKVRNKHYYVWATDPNSLRKAKVSREFAKLLPRKLKGDYQTINSYLKLEE